MDDVVVMQELDGAANGGETVRLRCGKTEGGERCEEKEVVDEWTV